MMTILSVPSNSDTTVVDCFQPCLEPRSDFAALACVAVAGSHSIFKYKQCHIALRWLVQFVTGKEGMVPELQQ